MDFASMLPVMLPIALFVVTLIIIFTLRASDKHSKSLSNVKRLLDIYKGNIEASDLSFKQYASELEQTVAKKDAEVKSLIQTVNTQITELKSYSDDLLRLKAAMETYRTALEGLGKARKLEIKPLSVYESELRVRFGTVFSAPYVFVDKRFGKRIYF